MHVALRTAVARTEKSKNPKKKIGDHIVVERGLWLQSQVVAQTKLLTRHLFASQGIDIGATRRLLVQGLSVRRKISQLICCQILFSVIPT